MAIPEASAHALRVHVVRGEHLGARFAQGFQGSPQPSDLWRSTGGAPSPVVSQITVVKIIREVTGDVGGQPGGKEPGHLRTGGQRTQPVGTNERLIGSGADQLEVAVTAIEMPFGAKVMVQAGNAEVVGLGDAKVTPESADVPETPTHVAARESALALIGQRHRRPELLHDGTDSQVAGIESA